MAQTVLIYATRRQRTRLAKQGINILTEYEDYVLARATNEQMDMLRAAGYEIELYGEPATAQPAAKGQRDMIAAADALPWGPPHRNTAPATITTWSNSSAR